MKKKHWMHALVMLCGIAACTPTSTPPPTVPGPTPVHILDPLMNEILNLGQHTLEFDSTAQWGIDFFEVSVNGTILASVPPISSGSCGAGCGQAYYGEYVWTPPSAGHFTISVTAFGNGQWGAPGMVEVTVAEEFLSQSSPLPIKPTSTPTAWISGKVMVLAKQNSNCREGGGVQYRIQAVLMKGELAEAVAISGDSLYLKVIPPQAKVKCWIAIERLDIIEGNVNLLPLEGFPAVPQEETATPTRRA